jgi:hypothetical protein
MMREMSKKRREIESAKCQTQIGKILNMREEITWARK